MTHSWIRAAATVVVVVALASAAAPARAYEADVHYGLTRWLALRAGFSAAEADAIAIGDQRVDGGLVETTRLVFEYACAGGYAAVARLAQQEHFASSTPVPAAPAARPVQPADEASRGELAKLKTLSAGKEGAMLSKLGAALHPLQDAWAHQGVPSLPSAPLACDPRLASAHPVARGGPDSHAADLTWKWPDDTVAMARATYDELTRYGTIDRHPRRPAPWPSLVDAVRRFASARSKSEKRAWFLAQGLTDTRFLQGIDLPDGADPGPLDWHWRLLPPLPGVASMQHDAPAEVRAVFDRFLARWLSAEPPERIVADMGSSPNDGAAGAREELVARLKLWALRDHGSAGELAHSPRPLSPAQLKAAGRLARDAASRLPPMTVAEALLPLQPSTPAPVPMLPYIVKALPDVAGRLRFVALARLQHAPYDSIGWIVERQSSRWAVIDMVSTVDP